MQQLKVLRASSSSMTLLQSIKIATFPLLWGINLDVLDIFSKHDSNI